MIKSTICLTLILFMGALFGGCTKDVLPDPATVNQKGIVIYDENFNEVTAPALPSGWTATAGGWATNSTAADTSSGYPGASGGNNLDVSNPPTGSPATYTVTTQPVPTVGYSNITVIWGARNSSHFSDSGSTVIFQWSGDGGNTWNNVVFTQNPNNSDWLLTDGAAPILLPASAGNNSGILFRWTATIYATPSGSYRLDDFVVKGTY